MGETFPIADWDALVEAFVRFFDGAGKVVVGDDRVSFVAESPATGLVVERSGALTASMPLHGVESTVEIVTFDRRAGEVRLRGGGFAYTYRVPPELRSNGRPTQS